MSERSCIHCGATYDERNFASHGQFCPHTLSGRYAAQFLVDQLKGCTDGVAADILANRLTQARLEERERIAQLLTRTRCRVWTLEEAAAQIRSGTR